MRIQLQLISQCFQVDRRLTNPNQRILAQKTESEMKYAENMELVFQATHNKLMPNTSYRNKIRTLTISPTLDFRNCKSIPTQLEKYPLMETEEGKK